MCDAGSLSTSSTRCSFRGTQCVCVRSQLDPSCLFWCSLCFILAVAATLPEIMRPPNCVFSVGILQCSSLAVRLCRHVKGAVRFVVTWEAPLHCGLMKHLGLNYISFLLCDPKYPCVSSYPRFIHLDPLRVLSVSLNPGMDQQCPSRFLLLPGKPHQSQLQAGGLQHRAGW